MPEKNNQVFKTTNFRYIKSTNEIIPDSVVFVSDKRRYQVIFDETLGWSKRVVRERFDFPEDVLLGRIIDKAKIFRIYQGKEMIEWKFLNINYEDIII